MKKILLVEDDMMSAEFMRLYLESEGYQILCSNSIAEACELLTSQKPDVVITDIELTDGSGFDIAQHAKQQDTRLKVAVSGHDITQLTERDEGQVFDQVFTKPLDLEALGKFLSSSLAD